MNEEDIVKIIKLKNSSSQYSEPVWFELFKKLSKSDQLQVFLFLGNYGYRQFFGPSERFVDVTFENKKQAILSETRNKLLCKEKSPCGKYIAKISSINNPDKLKQILDIENENGDIVYSDITNYFTFGTIEKDLLWIQNYNGKDYLIKKTEIGFIDIVDLSNGDVNVLFDDQWIVGGDYYVYNIYFIKEKNLIITTGSFIDRYSLASELSTSKLRFFTFENIMGEIKELASDEALNSIFLKVNKVLRERSCYLEASNSNDSIKLNLFSAKSKKNGLMQYEALQIIDEILYLSSAKSQEDEQLSVNIANSLSLFDILVPYAEREDSELVNDMECIIDIKGDSVCLKSDWSSEFLKHYLSTRKYPFKNHITSFFFDNEIQQEDLSLIYNLKKRLEQKYNDFGIKFSFKTNHIDSLAPKSKTIYVSCCNKNFISEAICNIVYNDESKSASLYMNSENIVDCKNDDFNRGRYLLRPKLNYHYYFNCNSDSDIEPIYSKITSYIDIQIQAWEDLKDKNFFDIINGLN